MDGVVGGSIAAARSVRALTIVAVVISAALPGCWSFFDGTFPSESGVPLASVDGGVDGVADATTSSDGGVDDSASEAIDASCVSVASGLIGHWTMDLASISGTRLSDTSGNQNDGTLVGFPASPTAPGRFGEALVYPASGMAYVHVPVLGLEPAPGRMNTVSLWFYRSGNNVDDILALLPNLPRYDLWLTGDAGNYLCINTGRGECVGIEDDNLRDRWVHVVAIFANGPTSQGALYVDGEDRNATCIADAGFSSCGVTGNVGAPIDLGGETDFFFRGMLDEVRIYDRALDAGEVTALYKGTVCP